MRKRARIGDTASMLRTALVPAVALAALMTFPAGSAHAQPAPATAACLDLDSKLSPAFVGTLRRQGPPAVDPSPTADGDVLVLELDTPQCLRNNDLHSAGVTVARIQVNTEEPAFFGGRPLGDYVGARIEVRGRDLSFDPPGSGRAPLRAPAVMTAIGVQMLPASSTPPTTATNRETPIIRDAPFPREVPTVLEAPPVREAPVPREVPVSREVPAPRDAPASREAPVTREAPVSREVPSNGRAPSGGGERVARAPAGETGARGAVLGFYEALRRGDGEDASAFVVPAKRRGGPFSPGELSRFFGSLATPLRVVAVAEVEPFVFRVRYTYEASRSARCDGEALVETVRQDGTYLISGIRALSRC